LEKSQFLKHQVRGDGESALLAQKLEHVRVQIEVSGLKANFGYRPDMIIQFSQIYLFEFQPTANGSIARLP
jgi:hypothetical protein